VLPEIQEESREPGDELEIKKLSLNIEETISRLY
jgi:hypothetical protein